MDVTAMSVRRMFRIMLYVRRNWLESFVGTPVMSVCERGRGGGGEGGVTASAPRAQRLSCLPLLTWSRESAGSSSPQLRTTTVPLTSRPRRPARPAICVYSPGVRSRCLSPSCLRMPLKRTHRAGMLTPMAKVSCARRMGAGAQSVAAAAIQIRV